jgi:general secretion pathway protein F
VVKALSAFRELAPAGWALGLDDVRQRVKEGRSLAAAIDASPIGVPALVIGLIRAGEAAGRLASGVRTAAEMTEAQSASRAALYGAIAYPLVLAGASIASVGLLLGVAVPRFARILEDAGGTLPASTRAVIEVAGIARAVAVPGLIGMALTVALWRAWTSTPLGLRRWHRWLLALPLIGTVRRAVASSRFCSTLEALLSSGVPLPAALAHAGSAMADACISSRIADARLQVLDGRPLSRALEDTDAVTTTVVRLLRSGEESGEVRSMLGHASQLEGARVKQLTTNALRLVEPGLILFFGCLVAAIAAALLQAMYSMRPVG